MDDLVAYKIETAKLLRYGAIIEVTSVEEALMAEAAQASAVSICCPEKSRSSLELSYRALIESVQTAVETPVIVQVMAVSDLEASIIEALDVDMVHEIGDYRCTSCVDAKYKDFPVPVVCASSSLWPLLQRFTAGASMICTQKEGSLMATLAQLRLIKREFQNITTLSQEDINSFAETLGLDVFILRSIKSRGILPLPLFARGSILSATDVYLAMSHGAEGVFVDNAIFKSGGRDETIARLKDIVTAASCGCDIDRLSENCPDFVENCLRLP